MKRSKTLYRTQALATAVCLLCFTFVWADHKPNHKPPGGGGGEESSEGYQLVLMPDEDGNTDIFGSARALREVLDDGTLVGVEVVGILSPQAYYWLLSASGSVITAAPLPSLDLSAALDINGNGVIVGGGGVLSEVSPLYWANRFSDPVYLPVPAGLTGNAVDINEDGMIVGQLKDLDNSTQLTAVWQLTGDGNNPVAGPLILTEATSVWAPAINDAGTVVVTSAFQGMRWDVTWNGTTLTASATETLTGVISDDNGDLRDVILRSTGINEFGDVCGEYAAIGGGMWGTFLLLSDGTLTDLPTPDSKRYAPRNNDAYDLNDAVLPADIQIVGSVHLFDKRTSILTDDMEVVWQGGNVTDLEATTSQGKPTLRLSGIDRVSNHGWLCGFGENPDTSVQYGVVLVPQ